MQKLYLFFIFAHILNITMSNWCMFMLGLSFSLFPFSASCLFSLILRSLRENKPTTKLSWRQLFVFRFVFTKAFKNQSENIFSIYFASFTVHFLIHIHMLMFLMLFSFIFIFLFFNSITAKLLNPKFY